MPNLEMNLMKFTHPCPVDGCTTALEGEIEFKAIGAATLNEHGQPFVKLLPEFPVHWSASTLSHITDHPKANGGNVMVIADTVDRARSIGNGLGATLHASPRSIQHHCAARGFVLDMVLVDDSAWPLSDEVRAELEPALYSTGGKISRVGSGSTTADRNDPRLTHGADNVPIAQAQTYLVLSEVERKAGFVRPVRIAYIHNTCGALTTMSQAIAETYARDPHFYGSTYCVNCRMHRPVGEDGEFTWSDGSGKVGS